MRGLGSGHSKPVEVTFGPSDPEPESLAGAAEPPQAVKIMLAMTNTPSNPYRFFLLISSSLEDLGDYQTHGKRRELSIDLFIQQLNCWMNQT